ncbi:HIT family protein [Candidatus Woesearchaeota archaeon]|nr:HIT family protein [Candidatus Woesearchaeota archaeon]
MESCIFCKIIKKGIPNFSVNESKNFLAFLDINPRTKGHVLIIPKKHYTNLTDFPSSLAKELIEFSQGTAKKVLKAVKTADFNFSINNGKNAGQEVFHAHFHIIPRFNDDKLAHWPKSHSDKEMLKRLAEEIKKA